MKKRTKTFAFEIFLLSLALILLEISYTRVFSFKLFYYFTYLIIGVSLLGIGSGGVFVALFRWLQRIAPARLIPACCLIGGVAILVGYFVVALVQVNAFQLTESVSAMARLALICTLLFLPFLMGGVVIATIFGSQPEQINRLYFADLVGASLGCGSCVPLLYTATPPGCVLIAGVVFMVAGMRLAASSFPAVLKLSVPVAVVLLALAVFHNWLPDPVPDEVKTMSPQRLKDKILFSQWSPVFRIDVMDWPADPSRYVINHDGMIGSTMLHFDGDLSGWKRFEKENRSFPFAVLPAAPKVMIIGAAGGHEILASLYFGADHITAVELNPVTVSLLKDRFADYSGHLADNPRVTLVNAEGRSFMSADPGKYDLIWFVAPDSYSAMNAATSGAFVLSESYLYTTEMVTDSLEHLTPGGIVCMQFGELHFDAKPNRTARYLSTAREAFEEIGVPDFREHVLLATSPTFFTESTVLLKKSAFTPEQVERFVQATGAVAGSKVWYAAGPAGPDAPHHAVGKVISLPDQALVEWYKEYPYQIGPVTDDSPFFWHFARFRDALRKPTAGVWDMEDATGERVLLVLLGFVTVFALVFLLLPLVTLRDTWRLIPYKRNAAVYFAALGIGFMFFEVCLIQMLTLFLGYPTYSLTVTLFALLVSTGIGSLLSARYSTRRHWTFLGLGAALIAMVLFYQFGLGPIVGRFVGSPLPLRVALAILFVVPLGTCLGAFMPLGLQTIAAFTEYKKEYVAWAWAVNGFFSVISSILATVLSMTIGFKLVLLAAAGVYVIGIAALLRTPVPEQSAAGASAPDRVAAAG